MTYQRHALKSLGGVRRLVGCEVGAEYGKHARDILDNFDVVRLYMIDQTYRVPHSFVKAKERMKGYLDRVVWIGKPSQDVTRKDIQDGILDFAYIDADHSYGAVKSDIYTYWPKLKNGGLLAGHDYGKDQSCQVFRSVNDVFASSQIETQGIEWWVTKQEVIP
jgi:hypothetical protein